MFKVTFIFFTFYFKPSTFNPQPTTHNPQPTTYNPQPTTSTYLIHSLSSKKNAANTTLAIPLVVIKAKLTLLKSLGLTSKC